MKTYDYIIRVSEMNGRDEDTTVTIAEQHERCRKTIADLDGRVGMVHDAKDVSGGVAIDDPAYQLALQRVQQGTTRGIVVGYSSRFARNAWATGRYLEALKKVNGELWFADRPGIDYRTPSGAIIVSVDAVMNDNYLQECKAKANRTLHQKLDDLVPSQCPFGYQRNGTYEGKRLISVIDPDRHGKSLIPDPDTAPIVRDVFERRVKGESWVAISDATGLPVSTIRSIIRNETYLGTITIKRRTYRRGKPTGEVIRRKNAHEPLVSLALWREAQSATTVQRNGTYVAGLAGGLARCGTCGGKLAVSGSKNFLTYGCRTQRNQHKCERPVYISKHILDKAAEDILKAACDGDFSTWDKATQKAMHAQQDLDAAQEAYRRGMRNLAQSADEPEAQAILTELREARDAAQQRVAELPPHRVSLVALRDFDKLTLEQKRDGLRSLVDTITVYPGRGTDRIRIS